MSFIDMAHSHVQRLLRDGMGTENVVQDGDGDYPFPHGTAMYYLTVGNRGRTVRIWSHSVYGLKRSKSVLREVNSVNEGLVHSRAFLQGGHLVVEAILPLSILPAGYLAAVCDEIGRTADVVGQLLAAVQGGTFCLTAEPVESAG